MSSGTVTAPLEQGLHARRLPRFAGLSHTKLDILLVCLIFFLTLWQNISEIPTTPIHPDESRWINRADFLGELAHPFGYFWHDQYILRVQPPMGSYWMGLALLLQGRDLTTNGPWNFNYGVDWNFDHGNMASTADRNAGRRANSVLGALTAVLIYFIGKRLTNRAGGLFAALFFAAHPLGRYLFSLATSDALLVFLLACATLAACRLAERPTWGRAVVFGIMLGLGGAAKLTPMLVSIPLAFVGVGFLLALRLRRDWLFRLIGTDPAQPDQLRRQRRFGWMLVAMPLLAFGTFVAVYPYLWREPITGTAHIISYRAEEMQSQGSIWTGLAVGSRTEALRRIGITLGTRYSTTGRLLSKFAHGFGREWHPQGFDLEMSLIGAELLVVLAIWRGLSSQAGLVAMVLFAEVSAIVLGMRADFERYHMPILFAFTICISVLAGTIWSVLSSAVVREHARTQLYRGLDWLLPGGELVPAPATARAGSGRLLRQREPRRHTRVARPAPVMTAADTAPLPEPAVAAGADPAIIDLGHWRKRRAHGDAASVSPPPDPGRVTGSSQ